MTILNIHSVEGFILSFSHEHSVFSFRKKE